MLSQAREQSLEQVGGGDRGPEVEPVVGELCGRLAPSEPVGGRDGSHLLELAGGPDVSDVLPEQHGVGTRGRSGAQQH